MLIRLLISTLLSALVFTGHFTAQSRNTEPRLPSPAATPSPSEALIQQARGQFASGSFRESAATWQAVALKEPAIASLARRESVRALIGARDLEPVFTELTSPGSDVPAELLLQAADAFRDAQAFDRAATLYRLARKAASRSSLGDDAALGLAASLERAGRPGEAVDVLRDLRVSFRGASAFDAATSGIARLSASLKTKDSPTENEFAAMVDRLVEVAAFRHAVDMELAWIKAFPNSLRRARIESSIVAHLYSLRANAEARERGEAFLKQSSDGPEALDVYITLFRLDVREGRTVEVETRGRAILAGSLPGVAPADRQGAARLFAEYLVSVGQATKALTVYSQLYKMTTGRGARIDVLWRTAIASLRAGQRAQAMKHLQQILQLRPDSETERAASFWLAYAQNASGEKNAARLRWQSLALNHPFTYYGLRAANWLAEAPSPAPLAFSTPMLRDLVFDHPDYQAAALLSRAGMPAEAAIYARRLNTAFRKDDAVALLAARASEAAGDYSAASTLMRSYFGPYLQRPASDLPDDFWTLAYPRAYWTEVSAVAARYKIDPLLMLGLARQESHFDREARSPVGAVGLFQVMPYTAVELDPSFSTPSAMDRLVEPAVSAELGAKLLASLQARFQGSLAPTIASYNADKERVQVWWDTSKGLPEELFIDSIPYQQTRAYVRQVLTNYAMYQRSARPASLQK